MTQTLSKTDVFAKLFAFQQAQAIKHTKPIGPNNVPALVACSNKIMSKLDELGLDLEEYVQYTLLRCASHPSSPEQKPF